MSRSRINAIKREEVKKLNINRLKGKIVECGLTVEDVSKLSGMTAATFYRRLEKGGESFTIKEIKSISKVLQLSMEEINYIFFSQFVA